MYCEHGRLSDGCEDCALITGIERGYRPNPVPAPKGAQPELADGDTYLDHGGDTYTYIRSGEPIPSSMTHLPRSPKPEVGDGKRTRLSRMTK
jgi:hypothetical protein